MTFLRQFANGMFSKDCIRILIEAVDNAIESEEAVIKIEELHKHYSQENCIRRTIMKRCQQIKIKRKMIIEKIKPPQTYWRRLCYHVVVKSEKQTLDKFIFGMVIVHLFALTGFIIINRSNISLSDHVTKYVILFLKIIKGCAAAVYTFEFVIHVLAFSYRSIWRHGLKIYFKSIWRIIDFIVLITCLTATTMHICTEIKPNFYPFNIQRICNSLPFLRIFRLLLTFDVFYPGIIERLNTREDKRKIFTYELGSSYTTGENEIIDMLPHVINNQKIRNEIQSKIISDRVLVTTLMKTLQKDRPWIAVTVKTKQAIRSVLSVMKESIFHLKSAGRIDHYEHQKLLNGIANLYRQINFLKIIYACPPKVIFKQISWIVEETVISFLFDNVTIRTFEPNEILYKNGDLADNVYIIVTGIFKIIYNPNDDILKNLQTFGKLPIVDYLSGIKFDHPYVDYLVSGNCIGVFSILTERPYNCTVIAESDSQVYVLSKDILKTAEEISNNNVTGLSCLIWKEIAGRIAQFIVKSVPAYETSSEEVIKYAIERSFVPNLSKFQGFTITNMIEDVILIEGMVTDSYSRVIYKGPCYIPRTVRKLILTKSIYINSLDNVEPKLLIIPTHDVDMYDVMILAQEMSELVPRKSTSECYLHTIRSSTKLRRRLRNRGVNFKWRASRRVFTEDDNSGYGTPSSLSTVTFSVDYLNEKSQSETDVDNYLKPSKDVKKMSTVPLFFQGHLSKQLSNHTISLTTEVQSTDEKHIKKTEDKDEDEEIELTTAIIDDGSITDKINSEKK